MRSIVYWVGFAKGYIEVKAKEFGMTGSEVGELIGKLVVGLAGLKVITTLLSPITALTSLIIRLVSWMGKIPGIGNFIKSTGGAVAGSPATALAAGSAAGVSVGVVGALGAKTVGEKFRGWMQSKADQFGSWAKANGLLTEDQDALTRAGAYDHSYISKGASFNPYPTISQSRPTPST
ncbi:hypothetical protein H1Y22_004665, partial [Salmonella enterica]|nr:hypothetical protein [Salmonella enterica]